ncbi:MAG: mitochondrial fission ELM1 family protein [Parvularculaceae bacterium]
MAEIARETCWVVTDGRAGIEAQAQGLAEAVARKAPIVIETKRVKVMPPHRSWPRVLWGDPFARLDMAGDALAAPWPALWIACGRLSVPFSMAVKLRSPQTYVVQLQTPHAPLKYFDLVIPPLHDRLSGDNVFPILGAPNRLDAARLATNSAPGLAPVAVLIGGPNKAFSLEPADAVLLADWLAALQMPLDVTLSRRTPRKAAEIFATRLGSQSARFYDPIKDGAGANPYLAMLGTARAILVTEDSVNMATEAASTGKPVYILPLRRKAFASAGKFDGFHASLRNHGAARLFNGEIEAWTYAPLDETARAASEVIRRWRAYRGE